MPMNAKKNNMTPKMALFCREYIKDFNATRAAADAGYSKKTAYSQGQRLLRNVEIEKALSEAIERRMEKVEIDAEWVLQKLVDQYKVNIDDFVKVDDLGNPSFDFSKASKEQRAAVNSLQIDSAKSGGLEISKIKVSLNSKLKLLEAIGRHVDVGAFRDKVEVTGKEGGPIEIKNPREILRDRINRIAERIRAEQGLPEKEAEAPGI